MPSWRGWGLQGGSLSCKTLEVKHTKLPPVCFEPTEASPSLPAVGTKRSLSAHNVLTCARCGFSRSFRSGDSSESQPEMGTLRSPPEKGPSGGESFTLELPAGESLFPGALSCLYGCQAEMSPWRALPGQLSSCSSSLPSPLWPGHISRGSCVVRAADFAVGQCSSPQDKISQLELELEEERSNSDILSGRIGRGREQVGLCLAQAAVARLEKEQEALAGPALPPATASGATLGRRLGPPHNQVLRARAHLAASPGGFLEVVQPLQRSDLFPGSLLETSRDLLFLARSGRGSFGGWKHVNLS